MFCTKQGGDVDQKIQEYKKKGKKIPEAQVVEWIIQLLLSVQYMHDRKILHRDLKTRYVVINGSTSVMPYLDNSFLIISLPHHMR